MRRWLVLFLSFDTLLSGRFQYARTPFARIRSVALFCRLPARRNFTKLLLLLADLVVLSILQEFDSCSVLFVELSYPFGMREMGRLWRQDVVFQRVRVDELD